MDRQNFESYDVSTGRQLYLALAYLLALQNRGIVSIIWSIHSCSNDMFYCDSKFGITFQFFSDSLNLIKIAILILSDLAYLLSEKRCVLCHKYVLSLQTRNNQSCYVLQRNIDALVLHSAAEVSQVR